MQTLVHCVPMEIGKEIKLLPDEVGTSDFILANCAQGNRHKSAQCTLWHNGSLSSLDQKKMSNEFVISIEDPFSRSLEIEGPGGKCPLIFRKEQR